MYHINLIKKNFLQQYFVKENHAFLLITSVSMKMFTNSV